MALVHCRECGEMIAASAPTCPKCGARQGMATVTEEVLDQDPSNGLNIVSFLWPFIGLILYFVYENKSPRRAKECGKWAIIGVVVCIVILISLFVFGIGLIGTLI